MSQKCFNLSVSVFGLSVITLIIKFCLVQRKGSFLSERLGVIAICAIIEIEKTLFDQKMAKFCKDASCAVILDTCRERFTVPCSIIFFTEYSRLMVPLINWTDGQKRRESRQHLLVIEYSFHQHRVLLFVSI